MLAAAPHTGRTVLASAYRLERRPAAASDDGATCLGQGEDVAVLLAAAEGQVADLLAQGEACVLCVVEVASGRILARRPVWPVGGSRPGEAEDSWWRANAEEFLMH